MLSLILGGCQTTSSTETKAQCAAWRIISYRLRDDSKPNDTAETVRQIKIHNQVGRNLGCWK